MVMAEIGIMDKKPDDNNYEIRIAEGRKFIEELQEIEIKNSEAFDRTIISLSTGSLGFSIAFLDKIVPYNKADFLLLLIVSWGLLSVTIILNIISHFIANWECEKLKGFSVQFHFHFKEEFKGKLNKFKSKAAILNIASAGLFIVSICLIVLFVSINILKGDTPMADKGRGNQRPPVSIPEIRIPSGPRGGEFSEGEVKGQTDGAIPPSAPSDTSTTEEK
jgi:hypothetical protein